jgi:hypothetical protein
MTMNKRTACALVLGCLTSPALCLPALAQTQADSASASVAASTAAAAAAPAPLQGAADALVPETVAAQILVSGKRPGPGLWKVSKGDHVMWVFGLYSPVPQKMEWDAARVERLVAQSQEVLKPPGVDVGTSSMFGAITALPAMIGMKKNPDGATLREVLPPAVYTRWQGLKAKYIGDDDDVERYRPYFASQQLMSAGLKQHGLVKSSEVTKQIEKIAKKNDIKLTTTGIGISIDNPRRALNEFKQSSMDDTACFIKTLDRFESDIEAIRTRANAWANGNIADIRGIDYAEREGACNDAVFNGTFAKNNPQMKDARERLPGVWLKAAETALDKNKATFAMLQMSEIVGPKSFLTALQEKGYTVESPK